MLLLNFSVKLNSIKEFTNCITVKRCFCLVNRVSLPVSCNASLLLSLFKELSVIRRHKCIYVTVSRFRYLTGGSQTWNMLKKLMSGKAIFQANNDVSLYRRAAYLFL